MRGMTMAAASVAALSGAAVPSAAQAIDSHGVRTGDVRIDATGVHVGHAEVTAGGVSTGYGGGMTINTNDGRRAVSCHGGGLVINGNHNRLAVAACARITIAGNDNVVGIAFAHPGSLTVPGNHNSVTWQAPRQVRVDVSSLGTRNSIVRR